MSWPKIKKKKIIFLKCHILLFYATTINYSWSDCDVQCKVDTRTGNDQLTGWTEKKLQNTSQSQTCTRKSHDHCLVGLLIHYSFLNPNGPKISKKYVQQSMICTENCNACRWHWSREWAQFFSMTTPNCTSHNQNFKSWTNWTTKFCLIHHIHLTYHQPTATTLSISTTFYKENASTTRRRTKVFAKCLLNPKAWIFYATGINIFFSKNVLIVMVPILINKDVLEPSYNDLI